MTTDLALTESAELRERYAGRTDALSKVKALSLLPDDMHVTTDMVAAYYEVGKAAINSLVNDHRAELERNGMFKPEGREFASLREVNALQGRPPRLFSRRAILRVGMLLTTSQVAQDVRDYLQNVEELADAPQREIAADLVDFTKVAVAAIRQPDVTSVRFFPNGLFRINRRRMRAVTEPEPRVVQAAEADVPSAAPEGMVLLGYTYTRARGPVYGHPDYPERRFCGPGGVITSLHLDDVEIEVIEPEYVEGEMYVDSLGRYFKCLTGQGGAKFWTRPGSGVGHPLGFPARPLRHLVPEA